jgi:hypothetical protein
LAIPLYFSALKFGRVLQTNIVSSSQFCYSLLETTILLVKDFREMGNAEKFSSSPTNAKGGPKRTKMIIETVKRTFENVTRQHARENTATKMDDTYETGRGTGETDEY